MRYFPGTAAKKSALVFVLCCLVFAPAQANRSFNELFPSIEEKQKEAAFSDGGLINVLQRGQRAELVPASGSGIDLYSAIMQREHNFLAELLMVVPHRAQVFDKLDAYNALGQVQSLGGRLYFSHTRQELTPLFEEATRIESARRSAPVPDPQPARILPDSETVFIRLRDVSSGNTFFRADFSTTPYGIIYRLANFRAIRFLLFPIVREENLSATVYMEPLTEGMLIYIVAGADVSNFVAGRIHVPSAIATRGRVFLEWVSDGLRAIR